MRSKEEVPTLATLVQFAESAAERAEDPYYGSAELHHSVQTHRQTAPQKTSTSTPDWRGTTAYTSLTECPLCKTTEHTIHDCEVFEQQTADNKLATASQMGLCLFAWRKDMSARTARTKKNAPIAEGAMQQHCTTPIGQPSGPTTNAVAHRILVHKETNPPEAELATT
jgi:hypothetical protein